MHVKTIKAPTSINPGLFKIWTNYVYFKPLYAIADSKEYLEFIATSYRTFRKYPTYSVTDVGDDALADLVMLPPTAGWSANKTKAKQQLNKRFQAVGLS